MHVKASFLSVLGLSLGGHMFFFLSCACPQDSLSTGMECAREAIFRGLRFTIVGFNLFAIVYNLEHPSRLFDISCLLRQYLLPPLTSRGTFCSKLSVCYMFKELNHSVYDVYLRRTSVEGLDHGCSSSVLSEIICPGSVENMQLRSTRIQEKNTPVYCSK